MMESIVVEYMCTYCGTRQARFQSNGRPMPGKCPRRQNGMPHRWVINRQYKKRCGLCS